MDEDQKQLLNELQEYLIKRLDIPFGEVASSFIDDFIEEKNNKNLSKIN